MGRFNDLLKEKQWVLENIALYNDFSSFINAFNKEFNFFTGKRPIKEAALQKRIVILRENYILIIPCIKAIKLTNLEKIWFRKSYVVKFTQLINTFPTNENGAHLIEDETKAHNDTLSELSISICRKRHLFEIEYNAKKSEIAYDLLQYQNNPNIYDNDPIPPIANLVKRPIIPTATQVVETQVVETPVVNEINIVEEAVCAVSLVNPDVDETKVNVTTETSLEDIQIIKDENPFYNGSTPEIKVPNRPLMKDIITSLTTLIKLSNDEISDKRISEIVDLILTHETSKSDSTVLKHMIMHMNPDIKHLHVTLDKIIKALIYCKTITFISEGGFTNIILTHKC